MSNLRIVGLVAGVVGLFLTLRIYRGSKWKRNNFFISAFFSVCCIIVCVNPDLITTLAGILSLKIAERGRLIFLLIFSNFFLWFLFLSVKDRLDKSLYQFDQLVRRMSCDEGALLETRLKGIEIAVIMPAYNEAENLKVILGKIPERIKDKKICAVVIDDGGEDSSREVVEQSGHLYLRNKINRGQGTALKVGYDMLIRNNIRYGVTMDSDGQHLAEDIEKVVKPVLEGEYDLVIGSRVLGEGVKSSVMRSVGILVFSKIMSLITGVKLTDCSSGLKAFDINKMKKLDLREEQFQSAEVIIEAVRKGLKIKEVPITIRERKHGKSKKGGDLSYALNFTKTILKTWLRK